MFPVKAENPTKKLSMAYTIPWNLIGLSVSGDFADLTLYTDRFNRKVAFPKAPPEKPPTAQQTAQRSRFTQAQAAWKALDQSQKDSLEEATKKGSLVMTGQNLYISVALMNDTTALKTLERQTGIILPDVPYIQ